MTHAEYRKECLRGCATSALDCKSAADYAAWSFGAGNEAEGRKYAELLEQRVAELRAQIHGVDHVNDQIAKDGPTD